MERPFKDKNEKNVGVVRVFLYCSKGLLTRSVSRARTWFGKNLIKEVGPACLQILLYFSVKDFP